MVCHVVYAANNAYASLAGVSMLSLFENNKSIDSIVVYILSDNIEDDNKCRLEDIGRQYKRSVIIIDVKGKLEELKSYNANLNKCGYITKSSLTTYARLILPELIPMIGRILYLDCDTMINGDISELFLVDMEGKPVALAYDNTNSRYKKYIGLDCDDRYYNAGVILIDPDIWSKNRVTERLIRQVSNGMYYLLGDQDVINLVLRKEIHLLPMKFNYMSPYFLYNYKYILKVQDHQADKFYGEKQWIDNVRAKEDAVIFHFAGHSFIRPWFVNSYHPMKQKYDSYYSASPWGALPQEKGRMLLRNWIQYFLYKHTSYYIAGHAGIIMQRMFMCYCKYKIKIHNFGKSEQNTI